MNLDIYQVDAFTDKPFSGNPAAVCIMTGPAGTHWMQGLAAEMNLSETAFLYREDEGFRLRWFTPTTEVRLCGHATLASAHVLWEAGYLAPNETAVFHTLSGRLTAKKNDGLLSIDLPADAPVEVEAPKALIDAFGIEPLYVGKGDFGYIVEAASEEEVRNLAPDFALLRTLPVTGMMVTSAASSEGFDYIARAFAPGSGIDEDPVTGAAHCCMGAYWTKKLGKPELRAYQASQRGGVVGVRIEGERAILSGAAVTVLKGQLYV
ncbi:MAG: PhzF family phenazine biosynthesis protein [Candidatus Dadabacteria bacterium]|nr:PhzF family phenazine biosynthesis protein [Candidatus Dadabacteria bacterium]